MPGAFFFCACTHGFCVCVRVYACSCKYKFNSCVHNFILLYRQVTKLCTSTVLEDHFGEDRDQSFEITCYVKITCEFGKYIIMSS